jgi:hypothetical protein
LRSLLEKLPCWLDVRLISQDLMSHHIFVRLGPYVPLVTLPSVSGCNASSISKLG